MAFIIIRGLPTLMKSSRRAVLASGTGIIAGISGCTHTGVGTPTPKTVAKVYIADGIIAFEPRGIGLYGQLNAEGLEAETLGDGDSFDPATGSFSVSGTGTARIAFASESLGAVTIIAKSGAIDLFNQGTLVKSKTRRVSIGPQASSGDETPDTGHTNTNQRATVYISQRAVLFQNRGATLSGQIGAQSIKGENLETADELDPTIGRFTLSGSGRDLIQFEEGSLKAISILSENSQFDVFYTGVLVATSRRQYSKRFSEGGRLKIEASSGSGPDLLVCVQFANGSTRTGAIREEGWDWHDTDNNDEIRALEVKPPLVIKGIEKSKISGEFAVGDVSFSISPGETKSILREKMNIDIITGLPKGMDDQCHYADGETGKRSETVLGGHQGFSGQLTFTAKSGFNHGKDNPAERYALVARQVGGNNAGSVKRVGEFEIGGGTINANYPGGRKDYYQVEELSAVYAGAAVEVGQPGLEPVRTRSPDHLAIEYARSHS